MDQVNDKRQLHGYKEEYCDSGILSWRGNFNNGVMDGEWEDYYENGRLKWKGRFSNAKEVGKFVWSYLNGNLIKKNFYL